MSTMGDVIKGQFPKELKLKAETPDEKRIWNYLANNMSEALGAKLDSTEKTIKGAKRITMEKHRKKGQNGKDSNRRPESRKGNWARGWDYIKPRKKVKDES